MKNLLILILILANTVAAYSQQTVSGKIVDENNKPVEGVTVTVKETETQVQSNDNGWYEIQIPPGKKVLSFQKPGYNVKEIEVNKNVVNVVMSSLYVDIFDLSLEELMQLKIKVASKISLTQREAPGIISVISKEEIKYSGCRDMIDVLRLVPGIEFGVDVQGNVNIIMRGNWANEGKILLMIDGLEMNELLYSTLQFGNHIPVEQIERVEIIRGPGSAIYGGHAEMGVINIVTKSAEDINGFSIGGVYGQMSEAFARKNAYFSIGKKINDNVAFALHSFVGQGNRSDRTYTDILGDSYEMKDNAQLNPMMFNFNTNIYDLNIKFLYDSYKITSRDIFDNALSKDYGFDFNTILAEADYNLKIGDKIVITPKINFKQTQPWKASTPVAEEDIENDLITMFFTITGLLTDIQVISLSTII